MNKKLLSIVLCLAMVLVAVFALVACEKTDENTYEITVWVGEGTKEFTEQQIKAFNETNEWGVTFKATVEMVSEGRAAGDAISKQQSAADIFCFAQDQLARLVQSGLLAPLNSASIADITSKSDDESAEAAKIGNTIRAFPMTADNGYFMFYDKRVISEDSVGSLEKIIADCEAAGKKFSMNLTKDGGGWYAASFFYATGCVSEWTTDDKGSFTDYQDTFNSPEGIIALKGMQKLLQSNCHQDSAEVSDFTAAISSAVVVSGIWGYNAAKTALGDNLGVAPLPSFNVDNKDYQLVSYLGRKLMGVRQQSDAYRALYLQKLAMYLTSEEVQLARFNEVGWGPSNANAQQNADVIANEALKALADSKTVMQGQYPTNWWSQVQLMTGNAKTSTDDASLQILLTTYSDKLPSLKLEVE